MSRMEDPYVYPGTDILKNKLNIKNADELQDVEKKLVAIRSKQGFPPGRFDYAHLKAIHKHLFQDVYAWAGQERTVNISKGSGLFALVPFIEKAMNKQVVPLRTENYLRGLDFQQFVRRMAHHFIELNAIHPFREGNGRALRAFFSELAWEAGYELDWTRIDRIQWLKASEAGHHGNAIPMEQIFEAIVSSRRGQ